MFCAACHNAKWNCLTDCFWGLYWKTKVCILNDVYLILREAGEESASIFFLLTRLQEEVWLAKAGHQVFKVGK